MHIIIIRIREIRSCLGENSVEFLGPYGGGAPNASPASIISTQAK